MTIICNTQRIFVSSQFLFGISTSLFMFLIPDIAQRQNIGKGSVWKRAYIGGVLVLPMCIWIKTKTRFTNSKGFTYALVLAAVSLLLMGFGQYEKNTSPLLYCLIYRVFFGCGWVFATFHGITQMIFDQPDKIDNFFSQFAASLIFGTILAPFLGYFTCDFNYCLLFCLGGFIFLTDSITCNFILKDAMDQDSDSQILLTTLLKNKPFIFSLLIQLVPVISISFIFTSTLPYLDLVLSYQDMTIECIFLFYKISFFISSIFVPVLLKSNPFIQKNLLTVGYLLTAIGFLLLLESVNSKNLTIISVSLSILGTSSGFILSNFYLVPPLSKLLKCLEIHFNLFFTPGLISQVLFLCTILIYFCKILGVILGVLALEYSAYSLPYLIFSCFFIILSILSKYYPTFELSSDLRIIELKDVNRENLSNFLIT